MQYTKLVLADIDDVAGYYWTEKCTYVACKTSNHSLMMCSIQLELALCSNYFHSMAMIYLLYL